MDSVDAETSENLATTIDEEPANDVDDCGCIPALATAIEVSQEDFPKQGTISEIKEESMWWRNQPRFEQIVVLGDQTSGKSSIINAILPIEITSNNNMMTRIYEFDDISVVDEWTMYDLSPQKLKYHHLFEEGLSAEDEAAVDEFGEKYRILLTASSTFSDGNDRKSKRANRKKLHKAVKKKEDEYRYELFYNKLSRFTLETLRKKTWMDYTLLPSGYIRYIQHIESFEDMVIPSGVTEIIAVYYSLKMNSFKFQFERDNKERFLELFIPNENASLDISRWSTDERLSWIGIIYVVDLTTYNEYFVDGNGQKRNKLEYALSVWESIQKWKTIERIDKDGNPKYYAYELPKLLLFTKSDLFKVKIDSIPLNVCPVFSDLDESQSADECLSAVCNAFDSLDVGPQFVDINDREDIIGKFNEFDVKVEGHRKKIDEEVWDDCSIM